MKRIIIAVVGQPLSGKDEVAKYLSEHFDFERVNTGKLVREYIKENDLGVSTRELMRNVGNTLREKYGADYFAKKAMDETAGNVVITGLRVPESILTIKKNGGFVIAVDSPVEIRYERARKRQRESDRQTFEEFKKDEAAELYSDKKHEHNVSEVIRLAEIHIENNGTLEEFEEKIEKTIKEIIKESKNL